MVRWLCLRLGRRAAGGREILGRGETGGRTLCLGRWVGGSHGGIEGFRVESGVGGELLVLHGSRQDYLRV